MHSHSKRLLSTVVDSPLFNLSKTNKLNINLSPLLALNNPASLRSSNYDRKLSLNINKKQTTTATTTNTNKNTPSPYIFSSKVNRLNNKRLNTTKVSSKPEVQLVSYNKDFITLLINNDLVNYSNVFLRDSCSKPEISIQLDSNQKLFTTASIINNSNISNSPIIDNENNKLIINWIDSNNDPKTIHNTSYTFEFLKKYSNLSTRKSGKIFDHHFKLWDNRVLNGKKFLKIDYLDYLNNDKSLFDSLVSLNDYGLILIENIPKSSSPSSDIENDKILTTLANRIGYIRETFYGKIFDVKAIKNPNNIAYSNVELPLHMDLLYYESPPGLQFLYSINNTTKGGESIFVDSFLAAKKISEIDPQAYYALTNVPIPYHYENNNEFYYYSRPLIVEEENFQDYYNSGNNHTIREVNYSPPFQAPLEFGITHPLLELGGAKNNLIDVLKNDKLKSTASAAAAADNLISRTTSARETGDYYLFKDFLRGLKLFEEIINNDENKFEFKLPENSCVVFNNRRVLHARKSFEFVNESDERWFKGCYIDKDTFMSRLRVLNAKYPIS
ncbi:oxidoreductase activity protein [[Candida] boidinii]|nr:oxidoreductase activity protein [[Candida] boidinii]